MRPTQGGTRRGMLGLGLALMVVACGSSAEPPEARVTSYLEGRITVSAAIDSIPDYRGFEVIVAFDDDGDLDTLGYAVTDSTGTFATAVTAPERGVYPLIISRRGTVFKVDELAVASGDTARFEVELPVGNRPLRIRSAENAAWMAYRNTKAQYNQSLVRLVQDTTAGRDDLSRSVEQATGILWSVRDNYPGTIAAAVAAAEAIVMLEGWNDSLLVARAADIGLDNPSYVQVVRAARRATARLAGQAAALQLVRDRMAAADDDARRAALQSEIVQAHLDSLQRQEALDAVRALKEDYPGSSWTAWADRVTYELEHLMPGMMAPLFTATTYEGETVRLDSLRGRPVLLEFYVPGNQVYAQQLTTRNALLESAGASRLEVLTFSLQPDRLLNEAFWEGRDISGRRIILAGGPQAPIVRDYNVTSVPTRVLIDAEGTIVGKYVGQAMGALQQGLASLGNAGASAGGNGP